MQKAAEMIEKPHKQNTQFVTSLDKAMRILSAFGEGRESMGVTALSAATGLDKSACQRFAGTFERLGYLEKDEATRRYRPSVRMTELANAYLWSDDLVRAAMPKLIDLRQTLGETINFVRPDGSDIIYVIRLPSARTSFAAMIIGRRVPALNTTSGRMLLALRGPQERRACVAEWPLRRFTPGTLIDRDRISELVEKAAEERYTIATNELIMNEIGVAVAVRDSTGRSGAIHCSLSATVWTPSAIRKRIVPFLHDAANAIS